VKPVKSAKSPRVAETIRATIAAKGFTYTPHALERMRKRGILHGEVAAVLASGRREAARDRFEPPYGWSYSFRGWVPSAECELRVVVGLAENSVLVVTAIYLGKD